MHLSDRSADKEHRVSIEKFFHKIANILDYLAVLYIVFFLFSRGGEHPPLRTPMMASFLKGLTKWHVWASTKCYTAKTV